MTYHECPGCGSPMHSTIWGPFTLVSSEPINRAQLDAGEEPAWSAVGLELDPSTMGQDYDQVLRHIKAFMGYSESVTGHMWSLKPEELATRIYQVERQVILPFWTEIPWGIAGDVDAGAESDSSE